MLTLWLNHQRTPFHVVSVINLIQTGLWECILWFQLVSIYYREYEHYHLRMASITAACLNCTTYSTTWKKKQQLYIHHLNVIISPQNVTELKTLKPWCSICAIASPARISICKAKALNQLYEKQKRCTPTSKRKDKMNDALPQKPQPLSWVPLCEADVVF